MGDIKSIIDRNLFEIVEKTIITVELCIDLKIRALVTSSEYQALVKYQKDEHHNQGASYLYTTVLCKMSNAQHISFVEALANGGNSAVVGIIRQNSPGSDHSHSDCDEDWESDDEGKIIFSKFSTAEVEFLLSFQNGTFTKEGQFEGLQFADEEVAKEILSGIGWSLKRRGVEISVHKKDFMLNVKRITNCIQDKTLWWNPKSHKLPMSFIPRTAQKFTPDVADGTATPLLMSELIHVGSNFLWLVDPPGMGKSTITTKLEEVWRSSVPSSRVIVRVDLNQIQHSLENCNLDNEELSLKGFLKRCVSFVPVDSLNCLPGVKVKVIVLLDALDEVSPKHKDTMLRLLHSLLHSKKERSKSRFYNSVLRRPETSESLVLDKLFLTTRPHLRLLIEKKFGVIAYSLLPLNADEQIQYLSLEVSQVVKFSEDDAEEVIWSLPHSAQSLMDNPLMLFLLAQVIKVDDNPGSCSVHDISELYTRFVESKHLLHIVEKRGVHLGEPVTFLSLHNALEVNIGFYHAIALAQLQSRWEVSSPIPLWGERQPQLPDGAKEEELLNFGLVLHNPLGKLEFIHRSFAEFFYASILLSPDIGIYTATNMLTSIYSDKSLGNVEEFMVGCCKKSLEMSNLMWHLNFWKVILPLFENGYTVLRNFMEGRLMSTIAPDFLSSLILSHDFDAIRDLNSFMPDLYIFFATPFWIRSYCSFNNKFEDPNQCLPPDKVARALKSCDNLLQVLCSQPNCFQKRRDAVESLMSPQQLRNALTSKRSLDFCSKGKEGAWWLAEILTKDELRSLISDPKKRVCDIIGSNPTSVKVAFGEEFLAHIFKFHFKMGKDEGRSVFHGNARYTVMEMLRVRIGTDDEGFNVLSKDLIRCRNSNFSGDLDKPHRSCWLEDLNEFNNELTSILLEEIIRAEGSALWDCVRLVSLNFVPYVVRYGKFCHVKKHFQRIPHWYSGSRFYTTILPTCLLLSLLVDKTNKTFDHLTSIIKKAANNACDIPHLLCQMGVSELREAALSCNPNALLLPVHEVSWGEFYLHLLPSIPISHTVSSIKAASLNFIKVSSSTRVTELLQPVLLKYPTLRGFLLREVGKKACRLSRPSHRTSLRLLELLRFLQSIDGRNFTWLPANGSAYISDIMNILVESCISMQANPTDWLLVDGMLQAIHDKVSNYIRGGRKKVHRLLAFFPHYRREVEWEVVLQTLGIISMEFISCAEESRVYLDPATPLLRVWLRYFGEEVTRIVAEEEVYSPNHSGNKNEIWRTQVGGDEAVHLAVELGSLRMLKEVAWPSLLIWRNPEGHSFLKVAENKWGLGHEVTTFLQQKFLCRFNV